MEIRKKSRCGTMRASDMIFWKLLSNDFHVFIRKSQCLVAGRKKNKPMSDFWCNIQSAAVILLLLTTRPFHSLTATKVHLCVVSNRLEDHLVGLVARSEAEGGAEVGDEERLLLEAGKDGTVDGLLVLGAAGGDLLGLWVCISI